LWGEVDNFPRNFGIEWRLTMGANVDERSAKYQGSKAVLVTLTVEGGREGDPGAVGHYHKTLVVRNVGIDTVTKMLREMATVLAGMESDPPFSATSDILNASTTHQTVKPKRKSRPRINIPTSPRATR
jgi:hypothetical protein